MEIIYLNYTPNEKVSAEMAVFESKKTVSMKNLQEADTVEAYCHGFCNSMGGYEFIKRTQSNSPLKVLDIGFGRGESSLLLASNGHEVHALEPSPVNCEILLQASKKFNLSTTIYQGVAEDLSQVQEKDFDLCIFNSSLHHCDDPLKSLQYCYDKLKKGGRLLAVNEPILKFYRSKKWFFKKLVEDPVSLGHYGGNEHIYYYNEYISLLKSAKFSKIHNYLHVCLSFPRLTIQNDFNRFLDGKPVLSDKKLLAKFFILMILKTLGSGGRLGKFLLSAGKRFSLFPVTFEGIKG